MAITLLRLGLFLVCVGIEYTKSQADFPILADSHNDYEPITSYQNNFTNNGNNQDQHTKGQSNLYGENKKSTFNQSFLGKLEGSLNATRSEEETPYRPGRPVISGERVVPSDWENPPPIAPVIAGGERVTFPSVSSTNGVNYIIGGEKVTPTPPVHPLQWHVGIYSKAFIPYMQICGGTLVTIKAVISAAHCFWSDLDGELPVKRFAVGAGKLHRPWHDMYDFYAQTSDVSAVHLPPRYRGASTNFQDDIAVVLIAVPFTTSRAVRPACVLFDDHLESIHLHEGNEGIVLGWGLTSENGPPAQSLQSLRMPYVPIEECIAEAHPSFLKYITSDKICAGVTTGKVLCRGDSGGGLVFVDLSTSEPVPLLFGVASAAPRNEHLCNAHARASLTRVLAHRAFLHTHIPDIEDSCEENYKAFSSSTNGFPSRILEDTEAPPQNVNAQPTFICNCSCNNSTTP